MPKQPVKSIQVKATTNFWPNPTTKGNNTVTADVSWERGARIEERNWKLRNCRCLRKTLHKLRVLCETGRKEKANKRLLIALSIHNLQVCPAGCCVSVTRGLLCGTDYVPARGNGSQMVPVLAREAPESRPSAAHTGGRSSGCWFVRLKVLTNKQALFWLPVLLIFLNQHVTGLPEQDREYSRPRYLSWSQKTDVSFQLRCAVSCPACGLTLSSLGSSMGGLSTKLTLAQSAR